MRVIIIHKSTHSPDSHHDYKIYKSKHSTLSQELLQFYDLVYLGIKKDFPNKISILTIQEKEGKRVDYTSKGTEQVTVKN